MRFRYSISALLRLTIAVSAVLLALTAANADAFMFVWALVVFVALKW